MNSQKTKLWLKAEVTREAKKRLAEAAKTDPSRVASAFDLQKTLPTPMLTCNKVYYSCQLWTYNLGVHNLSSKTATMFMWPEQMGSRGSQEIMSCLLKYIKSLPPTVQLQLQTSNWTPTKAILENKTREL